MALNTTALNAGATGIAGVALYISLHSALPDGSGSNATTHARVAASWGAASGGAVSVTNKNFTGGAASGAVTYVGFWSALTGGTYYGSQAIPGGNDLTSNAAGAYTLNTVSITLA